MRRAYVLSGHVQGVGFRWWARDLAERLGVSGWVRNERDGTVRIELCGDLDQLEEIRRRLSKGPPGARVESILGVPPGQEPLVGFTITG
jgi:acylphosphatase